MMEGVNDEGLQAVTAAALVGLSWLQRW